MRVSDVHGFVFSVMVTEMISSLIQGPSIHSSEFSAARYPHTSAVLHVSHHQPRVVRLITEHWTQLRQVSFSNLVTGSRSQPRLSGLVAVVKEASSTEWCDLDTILRAEQNQETTASAATTTSVFAVVVSHEHGDDYSNHV